MYKRGKLLCALLLVVGLSALLGGCVGVREQFLGVAERAPGIDPDLGRSFEPRVGEGASSLLACGLREVSPKEAGIDPEALGKDSQVMALTEHLERRGLKPILGAMRLFASQALKVGFVPFGTEAGIAFEERAEQRQAVALVKHAHGTLTISPDGREELWTLLSSAEVESMVNTLRRDQTFAALEKSLAAQGWRLQPGQSLGAQTRDTGLLYLAVTQDLSARPAMEYYRIPVSRSGSGYRMVAGAQRALCHPGDVQVLGMPAGAVTSMVGAYGAELQTKPADPCLMGLEALACLDTHSWLTRLIEEKSEKTNTTTLESFNRALKQEGVEGGVLYVEDLERATKLLLAGYSDLTVEQIETLLKAANTLKAGVPQSRGTFGPTCAEQQPTPAQLIDEATQFLVRLTLTDTLRVWSDAAQAIGKNRVLPKVGEFSGQDWFNYQVALFILAVKETVENKALTSYQASRILGPKLQYVLEQIRLAAVNFTSAPDSYGPRVQAWLDKIMVAARTHGIYDHDNKWFLLDFLRVIDSQGNEVAWSTNNPPSGQMIDVIVFRQDFSGHPNGTLLAFLKVDSSRPDRGGFNDPLGESLSPDIKAQRMVTWLNAVYNHISQNTIAGAAFYWHGMKIVGWIFMNPQNPAMMQQLVNAIQGRQPSGGFPYPFFIAYTADGRPEVVCFGCTTQAEIWAAWITACQMGGICASSVRVVGGGGGRSGSSDNMLFPTPGDPNDIGSVTPSTGSLFFEMPDGGGGGDEPPNPCDED